MEDINEGREQVKLREQFKEGKEKDKAMDSGMAISAGELESISEEMET